MSDEFTNVNLHDARQDVHRVRREQQGHIRFRLAEQLVPDVEPEAALLDVGCGRAEFSRQLRTLGYDVVVTDLSPKNIEFAREMGFEAHRVDLNTGLPDFADQTFAGVNILEVIEHVVGSEFLLEEIHRVLKPNGFLILSTPNFAFWQNRLRILFGGLSVDEGYHYRFFTVSSLTRQLEQAGFTVDTWRFSMPAFGLNKIRRWTGKGRVHLKVPKFLARLFAQTMIVRARKS